MKLSIKLQDYSKAPRFINRYGRLTGFFHLLNIDGFLYNSTVLETPPMSCFITFEGIEGCGKTTQIQWVAEHLRSVGHSILLTREPGGCPIADQVRAILLDAANKALTPKAELLLYAAARAQHVAEVIKPALARGQTVLCDRFTDATSAYQGHARGLDPQLVDQLNAMATGGLVPDLTILIDCPVDVGLGRAKARIAATNGPREERFEQEERAFHEHVRQGYLALAAAAPHRFCVIDGAVPIADVTASILGNVTRFLADAAA
jgi:dTMP kinase